MTTKLVNSTETQNNFGRILDDVVQNDTRYIIKRRGISQAIILSLSDFQAILSNDIDQQGIKNVIRELRPAYNIGETLTHEDKS